MQTANSVAWREIDEEQNTTGAADASASSQ